MPLKVNGITVQHAASLRTYRLQYSNTTVHILFFQHSLFLRAANNTKVMIRLIHYAYREV